MTIIDYCISLKIIKKILVVLGVVDMRQLLLNGRGFSNCSLKSLENFLMQLQKGFDPIV